jgi:hypothetical protein
MAMALTRIDYIDQTGKKIRANTVRIYKDGETLRISRDLLERVGNPAAVIPYVSDTERYLVLKPSQTNDGLRFRRSNERAKSAMLRIRRLLPLVGLTLENSPGVYEASIRRGMIYINLNRRVE